MQIHRLIPHPSHLPLAVTAVEARIGDAGHGWLHLRWRVEGSARLIMPPLAGKGRAEGLWQATCFELFLRQPNLPAYTEFNFSPSEQWAAYQFSARREGAAPLPLPRAPVITPRRGGNVLIFDAELSAAGLPQGPWEIGLCAVLEEEGGQLSYWALHHASDRPDFHDPDCFTARFAAPAAP